MSRRLFQQDGFSLIEFMVAMVLGLIIIAGAVSTYIASKNSLIEGEQVAAISENGRFALQLLSQSARHIGFFGGASAADIRLDSNLGALATANPVCTGDAAAYDLSTPFFVTRTTSANALSCITDAEVDTDVLVIKGARPSPLYDEDPEDASAVPDGDIDFPPGAWSTESVYIIANSESGILLDGADTKPDVSEGSEFALAQAWPYHLEVYYIRNGVSGPTLSRKVLGWSGAAMEIQTEDLVQGVENMRFQFGYDTSGDGQVDTIGDFAQVDADDAWEQVISMQVFLLVRNEVPDPDYTDAKTYQLGDAPVTPADSFRRLLMHSEITLRNPRLVLRGGS